MWGELRLIWTITKEQLPWCRIQVHLTVEHSNQTFKAVIIAWWSVTFRFSFRELLHYKFLPVYKRVLCFLLPTTSNFNMTEQNSISSAVFGLQDTLKKLQQQWHCLQDQPSNKKQPSGKALESERKREREASLTSTNKHIKSSSL